MNKKFLTLLASAIGVVALASCGPEAINKKDNILPEGTYEEFDFRGSGYLDNDYFANQTLLYNLSVGNEAQIEIASMPVQYAKNSLLYSSSNEEVATVSEEGVIHATGVGVTDVVISSKDGKISSKVRVCVSNLVTGDAASNVINNIKSIYSDEAYQSPTRAIRYEYSYEFYKCEGKLDHGTESYEIMGYDSKEGYFFYEGPSLYHKTPDGVPELYDGKWIMYPISFGLKTRIIHVTPTTKTFYDVNTASYSSNDRRIKDILNFFFTNGEKILNDFMEDYEGKSDFGAFSSDSDKLYSASETSLLMKYTQSGPDVVTYDDEINYMDIPTDTPYTSSYSIDLLNNNGRASALIIDSKINYELDGKSWVREFYRSQLFEPDFEIVKVSDPKNNGYTEVDNIYDL